MKNIQLTAKFKISKGKKMIPNELPQIVYPQLKKMKKEHFNMIGSIGPTKLNG
jgi:hypothetical protein